MKVSFNFTEDKVRKLIVGLLLAEIILAAIYLANIKLGKPLRPVGNWFDLDGETSIANWFSALQIFSVGLVFLIASQFQNYSRSFLTLISSGFIFLSMDEAVGIHERITELLKDFTWVPRFEGDHGIWIPIYLTIGLLLTLVSLKQFLRLWQQYKQGTLLLLIGITIYLIGAVGLEIVSYQFLRLRVQS